METIKKVQSFKPQYTKEQLKELEAEFVTIDMVKYTVDSTIYGYDEFGNLLFYFVKNAFEENKYKDIEYIIDEASQYIISNNRGKASGVLNMDNKLWGKDLYKLKLEPNNIKNKYTFTGTNNGNSKRSFNLGNPVYSNVIGYYDKQEINFKKITKSTPKCRKTQYTNKNFSKYEKVIPYFEDISRNMEKYCPEEFKRQNDFIKKYNSRIGNSCFSTITINKNFKTAIHTDKGDYAKGIGVITTMGDYIGGEFVLVDYGIQFRLCPNDILFVNVHKHHGNLPFVNTRYSMVSYVREKIDKCPLKFDYKVVIPSYKRYEELKKRTLKYLENKIPNHLIYIFIVLEEYDKYNELEDLGYNVVVGELGISNQRTFISNYFPEGTPLISIDDDCEGLYELTDERKIQGKTYKGQQTKKIENLEDFILKTFEKMKEENLNNAGVYPVGNAYFMSNKVAFGLKYIAAGFRIFFNDRECEVCKFTVIEDYERSLNYYKKYGSCYRMEYIHHKCNSYTLKGGINASEVRNFETKDKQVKQFIEENKEYANYRLKKDWSDIAFKRLPRFTPTNHIICSLWIGTLGDMERISIKSYLAMGYEFNLYMYKSDWVNEKARDNLKIYSSKFKILPAEDIIPEEEIFYIENRICAFSDLWRFTLLKKRNVVWTDLDMVCVNPLPNTEYIISSEHTRQNGNLHDKKNSYKANIGVLKIPNNTDILRELIKFIKNSYEAKRIKKNGDCMDIFIRFCNMFQLYEYVSKPTDFCPISWTYYRQIYQSKEDYENEKIKYNIEKINFTDILEKSYCIHLWNNLRNKDIKNDKYKTINKESIYNHLRQMVDNKKIL